MANNDITLKISIDDNGDFDVVVKQAKKSAKAIDGVTDSTKELGSATDNLSKKRNRYSKQEKGVGNMTSNTTKGFAKMNQTIGSGGAGLVGAYATLAASIFAITAAFGVLKRAAAFKQLEEGLIATGNAAGTNLPAVAQGLREITGEAISLKEAMTSVALGVSAGFSTAQMEGLTKVAKGASLALGRDMADAMSRLTRGAAKLEPEILDELGIMVRLDTATQEYAANLGRTAGSLSQFERRMAFTNAIIEQGEQKFSLITATIEANPFDKLSATFADLSQTVLEFGLVLTPVISLLASSPTALLGVLAMFASTLIKKIVPALSEVAANSAKAAAIAQKAVLESNSKQMESYTKLRAEFSKGSLAAKSVKDIEKNMEAGTASMKEMDKYHKKINSQIKRRETILANNRAKYTDEYIADKEAEIAVLKRQAGMVKSMMKLKPQVDTEKGSGLRGFYKKTTDGFRAGSAEISKIGAKALGEMEKNAELGGFKNIIANFKTLKMSAIDSFKAIGKGSNVISKVGIAARGAAVGVKLLGVAFLQAIPFIGQIILGLSLVWEFIKPWFDGGKIAKEVDSVVESFDSLNAIGTQLAMTLRSDATELAKFEAQLKVGVGALGQLETGLNKVKAAQDAAINDDIVKQYKEFDRMRSNFSDNSDPFEAMMTGVNDGIEREIEELQTKKDLITKESVEGILKAQLAFEALAGSAGVISEETRGELEALRMEVNSGGMTWTEYLSKLDKIGGPAKTLLGNMENLKGAMTGLRNEIKTLSGETDNPFKGMLDNLAEINSGFAQAANMGSTEFQKYTEKVIEADKELAAHLETLGDGNIAAGALLLAGNMKKYGETIQTANIEARTQGYIMAANRAEAKTSAVAAKAYAEAQNAQIAAEVAGIQAKIDAKERSNATDAERKALEAQITALLQGRVSVIEAVYAVERKLAGDAQKAVLKEEQAILKVVEARKAATAMTQQNLAALTSLVDLSKQMAEQQAITVSLEEGGSGELSAQKELEIFNDLKDTRLKLAEDESRIKLEMVAIEYELLRQRSIVALREGTIKTHDIKNKEEGLQAALDLMEATEKQLGLLDQAESLAAASVEKQLELNKARLKNEGLLKAYALNKEIKNITRENIKIIHDGVKAELDTRTAILKLTQDQAQAQTDLAREQAKNANLKAGGDGKLGAAYELKLFNEQKELREKVAKEEYQIKIDTMALEYKLLAFRLQVAKEDRETAIMKAPESQRADMRASTPDYKGILADAADLQTKTTAILDTEEKTRKVREDNKGLELQLAVKKESLDMQQKLLDWKNMEIQLEDKLLGQLKEKQELAANNALEEAKTESFASGMGGEISAQKELQLFLDQKAERENMLEKELTVKTAQIEMEYALLEARISVIQMEMDAAIARMPETTQEERDEKARVESEMPDFEVYKAGLREAKSLALEIAEAGFASESLKLFNEELRLANASSRALADSLANIVSSIPDAGIAQIGNSIIEAFRGGDEIIQNRARIEEEVQNLQLDSLKSQHKAQAAFRKEDFKGAIQHQKNAEKSQKSADAKQQTLDKSAGNAKMKMAATVATGIGGVLEGLAATQDTSSKEGFESAKKMQYAAAIVNTAGAIAAANAIGPPQSIPAMAFAAAAGAIQIATIASTSFEGGGGAAPSAPSGGASSMGGGAGSSTQGSYGQLDDTQRMDKSRSLKDMLNVESLQLLAEKSENAAWAIHKVSQSFQTVGEAFKNDSLSSIEILKQNLKYVVDNYKRKSHLGFDLDEDKMNFSAYREKGAGIADKIVPAMNDVLEDVRNEIRKTAAGLKDEYGNTLDIDMSKVEIDLNMWSKRMGSDYEGRLKTFENMIAAYANAVTATIPGLKKIKDATEGDFEEFQRLVGGLQLVNDAFAMIGNSANELTATLENADAAANFVDLLGGQEDFESAMQLYSDTVLTEAQRLEGIQLNSQKNIESIANRYNESIDLAGMPGLEEFKITATMDQTDFKRIFEGLSRNMQNEDPAIKAQAVELMGGLMETLPYYDKLWEAEEALADEVDSMINNLRTLNDLEVDLLEVQGHTFKATLASRQLEREELGKLQGEYSDQIRATQELIWAQQDLNAQFDLGMDLLKRVGLAEEATRLERAKALMGMDPRLKAMQQLVWAAEDAAAAEKEATKDRVEALGVLQKSYKAHTDAIKKTFNDWADGMKEKIKAAEENVSILTTAVDSLGSAGDSFKKVSKESIKASREEIKAITARVKAGEYEDLSSMDKDLGVLTADNSDLYGSFAEFSLAQAQSAAAIHNLKTAGTQALTTEEATLNTLNETLTYETDAHNAQMTLLEEELNTLKGLNDNIVTWEQAKMDLEIAKVAEQNAKDKVQEIKDLAQTTVLNTMTEQLTGLSHLETIDMSLKQMAKLAAGHNPSAPLTTDTFTDPTTTGGITNSGTATVDVGSAYVPTTPDPIAVAPTAATTESTGGLTGIVASLIQRMELSAKDGGSTIDQAYAGFDKQAYMSKFGALGSYVGYASGGNHPGGLRMVGEQGPELEYTGPSKIYSNPDTKKFFDTSKLEKEMQEMRKELSEAQQEMIRHAKDTAKLLNRWDGDGMPVEREL